MSKKKLKQSQEKCDTLLSNCPSLKSAVLGLEAADEVTVNLKEAIVSQTAGIGKVISVFRKILASLSQKSLSESQCRLIFPIVINVLGTKQLRQLSCKLLLGLAELYPLQLNTVLRERVHLPLESLLFMLLYCSESVKYVDLDLLKPLWKDYFSAVGEVPADENKFMFACRTFNTYIGAVEKHHGVKDLESIVDPETVDNIIAITANKNINRDSRQVLGLICLTLKTITTRSHLDSYKQLFNDSHIMENPDADVEFYRFAIASGIVSRIRDIKDNRAVLYERVLDHVLTLTLRSDIDKLFTIMVFKSISTFLLAVLGMAEEDRLHVYPEELKRPDPLNVDKIMLDPGSIYTTRLLALIQVHWSNKLEAVRRVVGDIHSSLIQVVTLLSPKGTAKAFLVKQVEGLLSLSWSVHGKYLALSQLVPVIGTHAVLEIDSTLPLSILQVMSSQHSVSGHCAALYCTLYKHDSSPHYHDTWLTPVTRYLHSPSVADTSLHTLFQHDEGSLYYLRDILVKQNNTDGLVRVLREGRRLGFLDIKFTDDPELFTDDQDMLFDIPIQKIKVLCDSTDDDKLLNVMNLISDTNKTALPMTLTELDLMKYIIEHNQLRQTPSFRKGMFDNVEKFLTRLNASCPVLAKLTKNRMSEDDIFVGERAVEMLGNYKTFIRDCMQHCYQQLIPSASFQRQVTVVGVLERFYRTISSSHVTDLTEISMENLDKLISVVSSRFECVRSSGLACISYMKDIPKKCLSDNMEHVLSSVSSPRGVISQINSAVFSFILASSLSDPGYRPKDLVQSDSLYGNLLTKGVHEEASLVFLWIEGFFTILERQIESARADLMEAAASEPIFPALNLLQVVLRDSNLKDTLKSKEKDIVIKKLLKYSEELTSLLHEPIVDESPEGLLLMGSLGGGSCGPQLLMSMTWRTMQSLCSCLVLMVGSTKDGSMTTPSDDLFIGLFLKDLLLKVRHHGVFENVHSTFLSYCATMWLRKCGVVLCWLDEVLTGVEMCPDDMSYTRRSAGIPSFIQAILVTEPCRNGKPKLRNTIERLLVLVQHPTLITARIHALNILHTLFKDSKIAEFVIPYIGKAFEISIRGFSNKLWPLRNSSTMLFSMLMTRMFNNKAIQTRQTTDLTFFTLFPNLHPYFLNELTKATEDEKCLYYPSLYPTLLILQRLTPCALTSGNTKLSLSPFVEIVSKLSMSGVLKTRSLAAETLSSIVPACSIGRFVAEQIALLSKTVKQNQLHGILLQIKQALHKCSDHGGILRDLVAKSWLLTDNVCPFTAALYLETLSHVLTSTEEQCDMALISERALRIIRTAPNQGPMSRLKEACVVFIMSLKSTSLTSRVLDTADQDVHDIVFRTEGLEEWLELTVREITPLINQRLRAALLILKIGDPPCDTLDLIYSKVLVVLEHNMNPVKQTDALQVLTYLRHILDPEHILNLFKPLCSSLNPWQQRLLLPACLNNIYDNIRTSRKDHTSLQSRVLWYLVSLLQDDDDGVRGAAAAVILKIAKYHNIDTTPELVLPILLSHLIRTSPAWTLHLLKWIQWSEVQDLMTSHYFTQYKSEGYAATSRASSPDTAHPLFEPDVVNSYAEALLIPISIHAAFQGMRKEGGCEEDFRRQLCDLSASAFQEFCGGLDEYHGGDTSVRRFVFFSKIKIFSECVLKTSQVFNVSLDENWESLVSKYC